MRLDQNAEICKDELSSCLKLHSIPSSYFQTEKISLSETPSEIYFNKVKSRSTNTSNNEDFCAISDLSDISLCHEIQSPLTPMDTNNDHINLNDAASSNGSISGQIFSVGTYVMAAWRNNFEYLAEVLSHRKRYGSSSEYKLRFVWDHIVEWYPQNKIREATKYEIDYVFQLCKAHGGPGCGRLLDTNHKVPLDFQAISASASKSRSRQRQRSATSEISTSDFSIDQFDGKKSTIRKRKSTTKNDLKAQSSLLNDTSDGMMYDKNMTKFSEACKRRRQLKREPTVADDEQSKKFSVTKSSDEQNAQSRIIKSSKKASSNEHTHKLSPHHSPLSKSSLDLCLSVSPKSTDTPDSVDLNSLVGVPAYAGKMSKNCSIGSCDTNIFSSTSPIRNFPCPFCSRVLRNIKLLQAHLTNYHPDKNDSAEAIISSRNISSFSDNKQSSTPVSPLEKPFIINNSVLAKVNDAQPTSSEILEQSVIPFSSYQVPSNTSSNFISGFIKCGVCYQRLVSHKLDPKNTHIRCDTCQCWSHQACVIRDGIVPSKFYCQACLDGVSCTSKHFGRYRNLSWANLDSSFVHNSSLFMPPTPPSTPPLCVEEKPKVMSEPITPLTKRQIMLELMSILNTTSELAPLLNASKNQIKKLLPTRLIPNLSTTSKTKPTTPEKQRVRLTSVSSSGEAADVNIHVLSTPTDEKLNQILSAFEDLCSTPAVMNNDLSKSMETGHDYSGYLQDLGPEILPELLPNEVDSLTNEELVEDFFRSAPGLVDDLDAVQKNGYPTPNKIAPSVILNGTYALRDKSEKLDNGKKSIYNNCNGEIIVTPGSLSNSDANNNNPLVTNLPEQSPPPLDVSNKQIKIQIPSRISSETSDNCATELLIEEVAAQHFQSINIQNETEKRIDLITSEWPANIQEYNHQPQEEDLYTNWSVQASNGVIANQNGQFSPANEDMVREIRSHVEDNLLEPINRVIDTVQERLKTLQKLVSNLEYNSRGPQVFKFPPETPAEMTDTQSEDSISLVGSHETDPVRQQAYCSQTLFSASKVLSKSAMISNQENRRLKAASRTCFSLHLASRNYFWQQKMTELQKHLRKNSTSSHATGFSTNKRR